MTSTVRNRWIRSIKPVALALCVQTLTVAARPSAAPRVVVSPASGATNVALVRHFLVDVRAAVGARDTVRLRAVVERYMDAGYIQHSGMFGTGRNGYMATMAKMMKAPPPPGAAGTDLYFVGNRTFVTWMSEMTEADGSKRYLFNMFRIENGKLKEHWSSES